MFSTRKKKHQHKRPLSQLNETSNDFVIGDDTNASAIGNETLEPQTNGCPDIFGRVTIGDNSICQAHFIDNQY